MVTLKSPDSEQILELNYYEQDSPFNSPYANGEDLDHLAFDVQELTATVEQLKRQGVEIVVEPYAIGQPGKLVMVEYFDIVDEGDTVIGSRPGSECVAKGLLHRAMLVFLENSAPRDKLTEACRLSVTA